MVAGAGHAPHREKPEIAVAAITDFAKRVLQHDPRKATP